MNKVKRINRCTLIFDECSLKTCVYTNFFICRIIEKGHANGFPYRDSRGQAFILATSLHGRSAIQFFEHGVFTLHWSGLRKSEIYLIRIVRNISPREIGRQ